MDKHNIYRLYAVFIAAAMLMAALAGCGAKTNGGQTTQIPSASGADPAATPAQSPAAEDGLVRVKSVEELIEAIRPGAEIIIEPGRYDLTEYLSNFPNARDYDAWNEKHEYVEIGDAYDGLELFVKNVSDLHIEGGSDDPADTEIVIEPRYAAVLNFNDCKDIEIACLTMGHTDGGDCSGDVLSFDNAQNIYLRTLDLYGCGVYGIGCDHSSGDLYVSNSTIRDCEYGPFSIDNGEGAFVFTACTLSGSGGGGYFETNKTSYLSFVGCFFGQEESNAWYWDENALFENCDFTEPDSYPDFDYGDYEDSIPAFDPDDMAEITFGESLLANTYWAGYAVVNPESGNMRYLSDIGQEDEAAESAFMWLDEDGSAWLEYRDETLDLDWYMVDSNLVCLENTEQNIYISLYQNSDSDLWMLMQYNNELIWLY